MKQLKVQTDCEIDFKNEIRIFKKISNKNHPHIVKFYEWFEHKNQIYIILEYCKVNYIILYLFCLFQKFIYFLFINIICNFLRIKL